MEKSRSADWCHVLHRRDDGLETAIGAPQFNNFCPNSRGTPMSDNVIHATDADFNQQVLESDVPVLVDFWAPWCGPCRMIAPALDELADEYAGRAKVVKVNVDENQATSLKYQVRSIPYLLVFKNGQPVATQVGAVGKPQLASLIDKAL